MAWRRAILGGRSLGRGGAASRGRDQGARWRARGPGRPPRGCAFVRATRRRGQKGGRGAVRGAVSFRGSRWSGGIVRRDGARTRHAGGRPSRGRRGAQRKAPGSRLLSFRPSLSFRLTFVAKDKERFAGGVARRLRGVSARVKARVRARGAGGGWRRVRATVGRFERTLSPPTRARARGAGRGPRRRLTVTSHARSWSIATKPPQKESFDPSIFDPSLRPKEGDDQRRTMMVRRGGLVFKGRRKPE